MRRARLQKQADSPMETRWEKAHLWIIREARLPTEVQIRRRPGTPSLLLQAALNFNSAAKLSWPAEGELVMDFNMEHTVYYPTLDQYKVCPAIMIQSEPGTQIKSAANGQVVKVSSNEELGNFVEMDLGGGYHAVYGQLKDIAVTEGTYVPASTVFATLNDPTKYYVVEGPNLYFQLTLNGQPVDPVDYLE